jgi:hypothetical protein
MTEQTARYYVDASGGYIGAFIGAEPPEGAIEVLTPPLDSSQQWLDGAWTAAPIHFPELKPTTFWKAAREIGVYKTDVLAQLNAIEDLNQREDALIDLEECLGFQRLNPLVVSLTSTYNITPEQLDDLWLWAANTQA